MTPAGTVLLDRAAAPAGGPHAARWFALLLAVLLVVDAVFLLGDVAHRLAVNQGRFTGFLDAAWDSQRDRSNVEKLGYVQVGIAVASLLVGAALYRAGVLLGWASLLAVVLVDDSRQLHETWGLSIAEALGVPAAFGLRARDFGELAVWAGYGLLLGLLIVVLHRRAAPLLRRASWYLAGGVVLLAAAGAGVDMLHIAAGPAEGSRTDFAIGMLESTGEVMSMSLLLVLSLVAVVAARITAGGWAART